MDESIEDRRLRVDHMHIPLHTKDCIQGSKVYQKLKAQYETLSTVSIDESGIWCVVDLQNEDEMVSF